MELLFTNFRKDFSTKIAIEKFTIKKYILQQNFVSLKHFVI